MSENLNEGLVLLVFGMGGVFVFLLVLVFCMSLSAQFFKRYAHLFPDKQPTVPAKKAASGAQEEELVAVALAAIRAKMG